MNERGTYGNGLGNYRLGGSYGGPPGYYRARVAPLVGADVTAPTTPGFGLWNFLLTLGIGAVTGHFIAKDPNKGIGLGVVGGFFAHAILEQTHLLRRINQKM